MIRIIEARASYRFMKILIIDNGSKYIESLKRLVAPYSPVIKKYTQVSTTDQNKYDLIILSGGHTIPVIGHESEFTQERNLIIKTTTPILGICLGFELVAHCFDAKMLRMQAKEKAILGIEKLQQDQIFTNLRELRVYESHRWVVTYAGKHLIPLAQSEDGIEIIKHQNKLIYGFQFHSEMFPDQTEGDELFANFIKIVQNRVK